MKTNLICCILRLKAAFFVFSATCAVKKHQISENSLIRASFQERRGGIGGDRVQSEKLCFSSERHPRPREWRLCRHSQTTDLIGGFFIFAKTHVKIYLVNYCNYKIT